MPSVSPFVCFGLEVLAVNIRSNPRIPGLCLPDSTVLSPISQYADDPSLICTLDDSIKAVFETYALFEKASGAKLNQSKSKGLWLGSWSGRSDPPVPLDWTSVKIEVLGVFIGVGNLEEANWRPLIDTVDRVLKSWRSHVLSLRGKALVINALALSHVWYVASLIHMPAWVLKELSFLAFPFFGVANVSLCPALLFRFLLCLVVSLLLMLNLKFGLFLVSGLRGLRPLLLAGFRF